MVKATIETPTRIDIFVDGSWLLKGQRNPVEAGGWGAVVVESYPNHQSEWTASAATNGEVNGSVTAEMAAAYGALLAVKERQSQRPADSSRPEIVLHMDDMSVISRIEKYRGNKWGNLHKNLRELVEEMKVSIVKVSHDKTGGARNLPDDNSHMATAHNLAREAAWADRSRRQGGINLTPQSPSR